MREGGCQDVREQHSRKTETQTARSRKWDRKYPNTCITLKVLTLGASLLVRIPHGAISLRGSGRNVPKIRIASSFHHSWEQNMRFISIMRKKSKVFKTLSLVSRPSQSSPPGSALSAMQEKRQEWNFWVTPDSEAQLALTPPLSLRKVHGGHLCAANLILLSLGSFLDSWHLWQWYQK